MGSAASNDAKTAVVEGRKAKFEITAVGFEKATKWTKTPKTGYTYYIFTYRAKNLASEELARGDCPDVNSFEYSDLREMKGIWARTTGVNPDTSKLKLPGETVGAGESYEDVVIFEVADSINPVEVFYRKSSYAKSQPLFSLSK
jgi:hypothetical protein